VQTIFTHHHPKITIVKTKATMEEKRENIRVSKRYAYILYKWGKREQACLVALWTRESRFDHYAKNQQGSSAFGIAQLLRETSRDPREQILKGLIYVAHRHDTPCRAKRFHDRHNWY
jgi:hypothetical protein